MMASTIIQLSQEIIDAIVDFVTHNSARNRNGLGPLGRDILNCSLVSRSFYHRSQFYIFEVVHVREESSDKLRTRRLLAIRKIMRNNPRISCFVQEIVLECSFFQRAWWVADDSLFLEFVQSIAGNGRPLRKLQLFGNYKSDEGYGVVHIPNFERLLVHFFRPFIIPSITTLVLEYLDNIQVEVITECVNLVNLELSQVGLVKPEGNATMISTRKPPTLRRLATRFAEPRSSTKPVDWLHRYIDFSQLEMYKVCIDDLADIQYAQQIINAAKGSLRELVLFYRKAVFKSYLRDLNMFCDLRNSYGLHTLTMRSILPGDNLVSVIRTLETIPSQNFLSSFTLTAIVGTFPRCEPEIIMLADWKTFCAEIIRVNEGKSFNILFQFIYRHNTCEIDEEEDTEADETPLDNHIESVVLSLLTKNTSFSALVNLPTCSFDITACQFFDN